MPVESISLSDEIKAISELAALKAEVAKQASNPPPTNNM